MSMRTRWAVAALLLAGVLLTRSSERQRSMPLATPLAEAIPTTLLGHVGTDVVVPAEEQRVAGMSDYVLRNYSGPAAAGGLYSLYVGYYREQTRGRTIHSPKNCLPGAGWEAVSSRRERILTAAGPIEVNRYLLQRGEQRALALYWYQGRGRVVANEYEVKWNLLRDRALLGRSDEALVRVIVPVTGTEEEALRVAAAVAREAMPAVTAALPGAES